MAGVTSISACGRSCQSLLNQLCSHWESLDNISPAAIIKERERFDLWARNIAALQDKRLPSSLEYRLRDDKGALKTVQKALTYLEESLELALSIVTGEKENETWAESTPDGSLKEDNLDGSEAQDSSAEGSEIVELYLSIQDGITNLFRLSTIIRKKPEVDEYIKAASKFRDMDPLSDIVHVGDKYPRAREGETWLRDRLGTAITRRRQYLFYRKEHQERMEKEHALKVGPDGNTVWSGEKASTYIPAVETVLAGDINIPFTFTQHEDSQTTYADSRFGKDGTSALLRTPQLPRGRSGKRVQYGEHFECPYCRRITVAVDKQSWKKHIMGDLRPYVCTFKSCNLRMFESQRQWFQHELEFHRKQWKCQQCPNSVEKTNADLKEHIDAIHPTLLDSDLDTFIECSLVPRIASNTCPLCNEWASRLQRVKSKGDVSLKQYREHVGRHMEQLALAALPHYDDDDDTSNEEDASNEEDTNEIKDGSIDSGSINSIKVQQKLQEIDEVEEKQEYDTDRERICREESIRRAEASLRTFAGPSEAEREFGATVPTTVISTALQAEREREKAFHKLPKKINLQIREVRVQGFQEKLEKRLLQLLHKLDEQQSDPGPVLSDEETLKTVVEDLRAAAAQPSKIDQELLAALPVDIRQGIIARETEQIRGEEEEARYAAPIANRDGTSQLPSIGSHEEEAAYSPQPMEDIDSAVYPDEVNGSTKLYIRKGEDAYSTERVPRAERTTDEITKLLAVKNQERLQKFKEDINKEASSEDLLWEAGNTEDNSQDDATITSKRIDGERVSEAERETIQQDE